MSEAVRDNPEADDGGVDGGASSNPRPYDFRRPYKAQVTRVSSLEPLHAIFATKLADALSQHLRTSVSVALAQIEQLRYDEFLYSIGPVTCFSVLRIDPPGAQAIFDLSLPVIHPMIVRLLGGSPPAATAVPQHAMTEIEKGLALQIIERAAGELADTYSGGGTPITVREESLESSPEAVRIMPADETVTTVRFDVRIGGNGAGGMMSLCLSDPILRELDPASSSATALPRRNTPSERQDLHRNILESAVELRALLAETRIRLSDVLDMRAGDVITTDKDACQQVQVQVQVEGQDKLEGQVAQLHGNRVVQITRLPAIDDAAEDSPTSAAPAAPAAPAADGSPGERS